MEFNTNIQIKIELNKIRKYENKIYSNKRNFIDIDNINNVENKNKIKYRKRKLDSMNNQNFLKIENEIEKKNEILFNEQNILLKNFMSIKNKFYEKNLKGENINVGILDSGINEDLIKCKISENVNFTNETNIDFTGHGTYLASVFFDLFSLKI